MSRRPVLLVAVLAAGALAACGGGGDDDGAATGSRVAAEGPPDAQVATLVGTEGLDFEPSGVSAKKGKLTLTLRTKGGPPHNLVFDDESLPAIGTVEEGQEESQTYTFTADGTYDFVCTFHPGMDGQVVVS